MVLRELLVCKGNKIIGNLAVLALYNPLERLNTQILALIG
jgi:hypothetical protein